VIASTVPLARDAITGVAAVVIAAASFAILTRSRLDTLWVIAGSAAAGLAVGLLM
jgi:hypothetical protein